MASGKTGLVVTAHPGDFVWRAGGAIALHADKGYRMKILCLSFGERGESQFAWKNAGVKLEEVKAQRKDEPRAPPKPSAPRSSILTPATIRCARTKRCSTARDVFRELNPSFVLTHSLEDPYNVDHPEATRFAQEARIIAQAAGHKPDPARAYAAPPVFLFEPHQPEMCNFKPNVILNIDSVWERKKRAFEVLAAQKHLWEYYTRVALNRGMQGGRNSGKPMTYGEAYQRLFPDVVETLA